MKDLLFHQFCNGVAYQDVALLDARCFVGRRTNAVIHRVLERPARRARQPDSVQSHLLGHSQRLDDVGRIAAGRDADGDISRATQSLHLPREYCIEPIVIPNCGNTRAVDRQSQRRKGGPIEGKSSHKFRGDMLSVRSAAPIAKQEGLVPFLQPSISIWLTVAIADTSSALLSSRCLTVIDASIDLRTRTAKSLLSVIHSPH
jgi:hypothetical protein